MRRLTAPLPYRSPVPVICIGNIVAGGAGKTPTALAIAALLRKQGHNPAFISRGYGGTIRRPIRVDLGLHNASDVGDEPLLLAAFAPCFIGRDRVATIKAAIAANTNAPFTHLIMDDGLQNPHIAPDVSLLVVDGSRSFGNGHVIPAGPLRETLAQALPRVTAVIIIGEDQHNVAEIISHHQKDVQILRASLVPHLPAEFPRDRQFLAFAGIAHPAKFYASCREAGLELASTRDFPDHHAFSTAEIRELVDRAERGGCGLITTAKDAVRLPCPFRLQVQVLPIELVFGENRKVPRWAVED